MPYFVDFVDGCCAAETLTITEPSISSLCVPDGRWSQAKQLTLVMEELAELRVGDGALTHLHSFVLAGLPKLEVLFVGDGSLCVFDVQTMIRWSAVAC